jgi:hypothetical protein
LSDEDFAYSRLIHLGDHCLDAVILRQPADGLFHTADELAFFRLGPLGDKFGRGHIVHEVKKTFDHVASRFFSEAFRAIRILSGFEMAARR